MTLYAAGLVASFALGMTAGWYGGAGWVEERGPGNGLMSQARKKVIQAKDGRWLNHGPYLGYYEDGKALKEAGEYFLGKKHGPWDYWYQHFL